MEKKYIKTAVLFLSIFLNAICLSCDGYLEKPPGVDVTEDTIFRHRYKSIISLPELILWE